MRPPPTPRRLTCRHWTRAGSRRSPGSSPSRRAPLVDAALVNIGDRLGLYRAMADAQPVTAAELAARTATHERYVREWLNAQAAGGYVTYDPATRQLHAARRARVRARRRVEPARDGRHVPAPPAPSSTSASRSPSASAPAAASAGTSTTTTCSAAPSARSRAELPRAPGTEWLPALDGVVDEARARRDGRRRRLRPRRLGDPHGPGVPERRRSTASTSTPRRSTRRARRAARGRGDRPRALRGRRRRRRTPARATTSSRFFDALHDMGDPVGAARHARAALAAGRHVR